MPGNERAGILTGDQRVTRGGETSFGTTSQHRGTSHTQKGNNNRESDNKVDNALSDLCACDPRSLAYSSSGGGGAKAQLFNTFSSPALGLVRQVGPTRILTPIRHLELPKQSEGGTEAWQLFALFDCALACGHPTVVVDYTLQVCQDPAVVSSDPIESFLMNQAVVEMWCEEVALYLRREFFSMLETMDPASSDQHFYSKGLWIEKLLQNLQLVLTVLHHHHHHNDTNTNGRQNRGAATSTSSSTPMMMSVSMSMKGVQTTLIEEGDVNSGRKGSQVISDTLAQVGWVLEACKICNWSCAVGLFQLSKTGRYGSTQEWRQSLEKRCAYFGHNDDKKKLFIFDMMRKLGMDSNHYPFVSFIDAIKKIFLSPNRNTNTKETKVSGGSSLKLESECEIRVFLYYLMDMCCLEEESLLQSFAAHFGVTHAVLATVKIYAQLDSSLGGARGRRRGLSPGGRVHDSSKRRWVHRSHTSDRGSHGAG